MPGEDEEKWRMFFQKKSCPHGRFQRKVIEICKQRESLLHINSAYTEFLVVPFLTGIPALGSKSRVILRPFRKFPFQMAGDPTVAIKLCVVGVC